METAAAADFGINRRTERRIRVLKAGRLVFNHGFSAMDCIVRNISSGGALIDVPSVIGLPEKFAFIVAGNSPRNAKLAWRSDHLAGVCYTYN